MFAKSVSSHAQEKLLTLKLSYYDVTPKERQKKLIQIPLCVLRLDSSSGSSSSNGKCRTKEEKRKVIYICETSRNCVGLLTLFFSQPTPTSD